MLVNGSFEDVSSRKSRSYDHRSKSKDVLIHLSKDFNIQILHWFSSHESN